MFLALNEAMYEIMPEDIYYSDLGLQVGLSLNFRRDGGSLFQRHCEASLKERLKILRVGGERVRTEERGGGMTKRFIG